MTMNANVEGLIHGTTRLKSVVDMIFVSQRMRTPVLRPIQRRADSQRKVLNASANYLLWETSVMKKGMPVLPTITAKGQQVMKRAGCMVGARVFWVQIFIVVPVTRPTEMTLTTTGLTVMYRRASVRL